VPSRKAPPGAAASLLRRRGAPSDAKVTNIELFFDLVFVFAVTQLSHRLLENLSLRGAVETTLLFLAVWWVWIYTSWVTNWLDPERVPVRIMMFVLMLAGLALSSSLPHAFENEGLLFAGAYVLMQVGRTVFTLWAVADSSRARTRNFQRVTLWLLLSGLFWMAGAAASGDLRLGLWALAVGIEYASAVAGFWVPGFGRSVTTDWDIQGEHLAERCSLFIIIALGESIVVTGSTAAGLEATAATTAAFLVAFVSSVAMWWIYFNIGVERGARQIASAADPGRLGRLVYTYLHLLIVAGIIVGAVADELVLAHPTGHAELHALLAIIGGPALFLLGNLCFKRVIWGRAPLSHMVGLLLLALAAPAALAMTPLLLAFAVTAVLLTVAAWETASLQSGTGPTGLEPSKER
jgi:low temperature requirement protein LtrA